MQWASALSTQPSLEAAVEAVVTQALAQLQAGSGADAGPDVRPDLGFVFISSAFASEYSRLLPLLQAKLPQVPLIGCNGGVIIGMGTMGKAQEIEEGAALSLTLARLPGVKIHCFQVDTEDLPDLDGAPSAWADLVGVEMAELPQFVVLADPMTNGINDFLAGLDYAYPQSVKVGGLASSSSGSAASGLFCGDRYYKSGAVGVALSGNLVLDAIVAQGCRPIGQPYWVTASERNIILGLREDGLDPDKAPQTSPLEMLRALVDQLEEADQELAKHSLFVGVAQNSFKQSLEPGDFLVRNLLGFDPREGALAIGDRIRPGQRIQFHLRDAHTAAEDLEGLLVAHRQQGAMPAPIGALMFSCMGRGEGLYGEPNFDSRLFAKYTQNLPLGGVFCNGEIGPVGGTSFLHGFTSVFGIFRPRV
jgi:small ligand-binding sensory domain FIST